MTPAVTKITANGARVVAAGEKPLASIYYLWDFCGVGPTALI
jgi:hypothetical protein